METFINTAD